MVKIGSVKIDTNIFLAPLSGCSDLPFRLIAREHGARFCFFEMADAHTLVRRSRQTTALLKTSAADKPIAGQLLGGDPAIMQEAAARYVELVPDVSFIDINSACPVRKVIKKKAGAYLLQDPRTLCAIVKKLAASLPVPVTVKMRLGHLMKDDRKIVTLAKKCEDAGAAALFVHGRTGSQKYSGEVDYAAIQMIKDTVTVPVFGIGNIFSPERAKLMFDETGCDGIMVARGALGNPWIFSSIEHHLSTGAPGRAPSLRERKAVLKKHLSYVDTFKDMVGHSKVGFMRKVSLWYLRGFPDAASVRSRITSAKSLDAILEIIDSVA